MITRSQKGIIKPNPKYVLTSTTNSTNIPREPHNIRAALAHPRWKVAMDEELEALHKNKTWVLVPRTSDMHVIGSKWVFKPKLKLDAQFKMKDLGQIHHFLGIELSQTSDCLHLSQSHYALTILERPNMVDYKPISTPLKAKTRTSSNNVLLEDQSYFRGLVGALQYLTLTRLDLSYSVNYASQFMHAPTVVHLKMVQRILRYVKGTIDISLHFTSNTTLDLCAFSNADWAGCLTTRRSITGYYLHIPLASTPTLYCDNTSALHMTINLVFHARSKHIELDYHFVRERVALGLLVTQHISTEKQVVDLFTKPMSKVALSNFQTKLCLQARHSLREGIGTTQHLGVNCGTQRSDKVEHNYGSDKVENSHNSCYNSGEMLKYEGISMATTST
ncbi:hypothetical protein AAG906_018835 [Vitis piasezkii]